jgi:hypothetical protein
MGSMLSIYPRDIGLFVSTMSSVTEVAHIPLQLNLDPTSATSEAKKILATLLDILQNA